TPAARPWWAVAIRRRRSRIWGWATRSRTCRPGVELPSNSLKARSFPEWKRSAISRRGTDAYQADSGGQLEDASRAVRGRGVHGGLSRRLPAFRGALDSVLSAGSVPRRRTRSER